MKIIIGAGRTFFDGWISTQEYELDLLNRADFERLFAAEKPTAFLAVSPQRIVMIFLQTAVISE